MHRSVQHHYIPRFLIQNFSSDGQVWVGEKETKKVFKSSPNNLFKERDLNTSYDLNNVDSKHDKHEQLLSRIDSDAAPIIQKLLACSRNSEPLDISEEERDYWKRFYHSICRRTPELMKTSLQPDERYDDAWQIAVERKFSDEGMVAPNRAFVDQDPTLRKIRGAMKQNTKARFASGDHSYLQDDVERFCRGTSLLIAVIRCSKRSFVIGSQGVAIIRKGKAQGSWLPIAHDVAVAATSHPEKDWFLSLDRSNEHLIRQINTAAAHQSLRFAGRSEQLIRSLMTH